MREKGINIDERIDGGWNLVFVYSMARRRRPSPPNGRPTRPLRAAASAVRSDANRLLSAPVSACTKANNPARTLPIKASSRPSIWERAPTTLPTRTRTGLFSVASVERTLFLKTLKMASNALSALLYRA